MLHSATACTQRERERERRENHKAKNRSENTYKVHLMLKTTDLKLGNKLPVLFRRQTPFLFSRLSIRLYLLKKLVQVTLYHLLPCCCRFQLQGDFPEWTEQSILHFHPHSWCGSTTVLHVINCLCFSILSPASILMLFTPLWGKEMREEERRGGKKGRREERRWKEVMMPWTNKVRQKLLCDHDSVGIFGP